MKDSQLEKMSLKELTALHAKIQEAIDEKRVSERHEMRAKMEDMARASGFSVADLFGRKGKTAAKALPSIATRKDPSQTWTGRGRRPNWMVAAGGDGKRFFDYLLNTHDVMRRGPASAGSFPCRALQRVRTIESVVLGERIRMRWARSGSSLAILALSCCGCSMPSVPAIAPPRSALALTITQA